MCVGRWVAGILLAACAWGQGLRVGTGRRDITPREPHNGYLILQGGLPETEEFVSSHWK